MHTAAVGLVKEASGKKCAFSAGTRLHTLATAAAAVVGVVTETNAEKAIEELKAYEVCYAPATQNIWMSFINQITSPLLPLREFLMAL